MLCYICREELPDDSRYCHYCGAQQKRGRSLLRSHSLGCAYKRGKVWEAQVIVGYKDGIAIKKRKSGFSTKREALEYCARMRIGEIAPARLSLKQVYDAWEKTYQLRVAQSTMVSYAAAFGHFAPLHQRIITSINVQDLQNCMDVLPLGCRTRENMKTVVKLIWTFAIGAGYADRDLSGSLFVGRVGTKKQRPPITEDELGKIKSAIGTELYADYVYAMCFLGFRPGEMLALKKTDLHKDGEVTFLVGGSKTEAGRDRRVPVPQVILPIIERLAATDSEWLFPRVSFYKDGTVRSYGQMTDTYFRESVFKPMMKRLGIAAGKVPYCARHTYADKLKRATGADRDKAALIGHASYATTQAMYQSSNLRELQEIVDSFE